MSTTRWRALRWPIVVAAAVALTGAGCGSDDGGVASTTEATSASEATVVHPDSLPDGGAAPGGTDAGGTALAGTATDPTVTGVLPDGFTTVTAVITDADGVVCEVCLWLADTADERARGLMGVTDLGDAGGMLFRFDDVTQSSFYMFQTPTPLSIAWFGDDGAWVGEAEMDPCLDTSAGDCPLYSPEAPYRFALEAFAGGLEPLGAGPGSTLEVVEGSEAPTCVLAAG